MRHLTTLTSLAFLLLLFACDGKKSETQTQESEATMEHEGHAMQGEMAADMVIDPVCEMKIKKEDAAGTYEYDGKTYYFCMESHKQDFVKNPEAYLAATHDEHQHRD